MADLNQYLERVLEEEDKVLLTEASACLEADARRAAYVTTWLAVAEALRRKFVAASTYDHEAGRISREIESLEEEHKAVDGLLVTKAKEYGLISDAESTRLRHIYENRNVFGHPYEQEPSQQLVETAASEALDIVLGQPLVLRHGYLERQVTRLATEVPFLNDDQQTVEEFARTVHTRSASDLAIWFVQKLVTALDAVFAEPALDLLQRRGLWFLKAFLLADPAVFAGWDVANDLPDHRRVLPLLLADIDLFPHLSDHAKDIVVNTLLQESADTPPRFVQVFRLSEAGVLRTANQEALEQATLEAPLSRLRSSELPFSAYWRRVIAQLESHSWDPQNEAIRAITSAGQEAIAELDDGAQDELGRNVLQAADGRAFSAINFLSGVAAEDGWPLAFVRGIVFEPIVNESGGLRLKPQRLVSALKAGLRIDQPERDRLFDDLRGALRDGSVDNPWWFRHTSREAIENLREAGAQGSEQMNAIANQIEAVVAELPEETV